MTTRISLLCHAATAAIRAVDFPTDEPLDPLGLRKLSAVSHRLDRADRVWTSPALRAVETAEALGLRPDPDPLLDEWDYGRWRGRSLEAVQAAEPENVLSWLRDPAVAPHGGETLLAVMGRAATWLDAQKQTAGSVFAVTHASIIRAAIVGAVEASPASFWRFDIAPLSVTRLTCSHGRWSLSSIGPLVSKAVPVARPDPA